MEIKTLFLWPVFFCVNWCCTRYVHTVKYKHTYALISHSFSLFSFVSPLCFFSRYSAVYLLLFLSLLLICHSLSSSSCPVSPSPHTPQCPSFDTLHQHLSPHTATHLSHLHCYHLLLFTHEHTLWKHPPPPFSSDNIYHNRLCYR